MRSVLATLSLMAAMMAAAPGLAAPPTVYLAPDGPPAPLMTEAQREAIGLWNGPDSIVDLWQYGGRDWLVFSGATRQGQRAEGGQTFRLAVDAAVTRVSPPLEPIMHAVCRAGTREDAAHVCTKFDSDYAGAGTMVPCPDTPAYIYHGENHTAPDGRMTSEFGWTGIGQAHWDARSRQLVSDGQVAGLNIAHDRGDEAGSAKHIPAASGNPSVVADPTGAFLYMYFGDRAGDPRGDGMGQNCGTRTCWAVARTDRAGFCAAAAAGRTAVWQKLHLGRFDQPALLPGAVGGMFTPLLDFNDGVDNLANVTALPAQHLYVMASILRPGADVVERVSRDGLTWSSPVRLVEAAPGGGKLDYPRIVLGSDGPLLLYVVISRQLHWRDAVLMRQKLKLAGR